MYFIFNFAEAKTFSIILDHLKKSTEKIQWDH